MAVENHGGGKRVLRVRCRVRPSFLAASGGRRGGVAMVGLAALAWSRSPVTVAIGMLGLLAVGGIVSAVFGLGRVMYHVRGDRRATASG